MQQENIIIEKIKNKLPTSTVFSISFANEPGNYLNSKIGGSFFWPNKPLPELKFLAQINFSELPANDIFPKQGLLQFFIKDNDSYGLFDENRSLVVYHDDISQGNEHEIAFPNSPILKNAKMNFAQNTEHLSYSDFRFDKIVKQYTDSYSETLYKEFDGAGSKILGYPFFCQYDPRDNNKYDTLLFQLDSKSPFVMWGDSGVANFFIKSKALKKLDFSDILYNWDCC